MINKKRTAWIIASPFIAAGYAMAQISVGPTLVFDPTVLAKIAEETVQVVQIATATAATYAQLQYEAAFLTNKWAFRSAVMNSLNTFLHTTPVTDPWAKTVLNGLDAARGYGTAAMTLETNPRMIVMGDPRAPFYATAQIGAANNTRALQAIGNANLFDAQMAQPVQQCQQSAMSESSDSNTNAAQLNISNSCAVLALRYQQAALNVESARLGVELAQSKMQTDSLTEYLNMVTPSENAALQQASAPAIWPRRNKTTSRNDTKTHSLRAVNSCCRSCPRDAPTCTNGAHADRAGTKGHGRISG